MIIPEKKFGSNEFYVNLRSSFKSQLVRCQNIMDDTKFDQVVIRGLGKAKTRTVNLAEQLNSNNYGTFEIIKEEYEVETEEDAKKKIVKEIDFDIYDPDDELKFAKKTYKIPAIKIIVRKNAVELNKLKEIRKKKFFSTK